MTASLNTQSATLIDRIINFHALQSQEISLTKLYQLLYLIDFGHCALHGVAVSHFEYFGHKNELFAIGAADYVQLSSPKKQAQDLQEPAIAYATPDTLPDTALSVIEKTLARLCTVSEKEIHKTIRYHPTWVIARGGKILDIKYAENCDFEWLDYFSHEMTREEYEELERERTAIENNEEITKTMKRLQKIKI